MDKESFTQNQMKDVEQCVRSGRGYFPYQCLTLLSDNVTERDIPPGEEMCPSGCYHEQRWSVRNSRQKRVYKPEYDFKIQCIRVDFNKHVIH